MAAKKGLGTGLDILFGESTRAEEEHGSIKQLPIAKVEPRENQPRTLFDEEALAELAESIREYGLIQPVTVRKLDSGYYQLIAGERRWRAARMAGLNEIPARIIEADDRLATELALVENLQREDLNPVEEAQGYRTLMEEYGLTQDEAAQRVGKSRPAVANALRLLSLAPEVLQFVEQGLLSAGHARALVPVKPEELQIDAARQEIVRLVNQVRRENGAPELTVNAALMDAAQHCASLRVTYHQNKVECEAVAASGYPHGFGSNITAFANVPASEIAERAVENWRNSPGHFQTMINPDCDTIGVGISTDEGGTICFLFVGDPNAHNPYA